MTERERVCWPQNWIEVATIIAKNRSSDPRLQVCAIVVPEDNTGILALGYNGMVKGLSNEVESIQPGRSGTIHAEQNCLVKCPFYFPVKKHMYITHSPCRDCAKLIANAQIARVVYDVPYRDLSGVDLLRQAGIEVLSLKEAILIAKR